MVFDQPASGLEDGVRSLGVPGFGRHPDPWLRSARTHEEPGVPEVGSDPVGVSTSS